VKVWKRLWQAGQIKNDRRDLEGRLVAEICSSSLSFRSGAVESTAASPRAAGRNWIVRAEAIAFSPRPVRTSRTVEAVRDERRRAQWRGAANIESGNAGGFHPRWRKLQDCRRLRGRKKMSG